MDKCLRIAGVLLLVGGMSAAQIGPPACPVKPGGPPVSLTPAVRPTAEEIKATAAAATADPTMMLAAEPMANFGTERYRLADYAECVGGGGCYWADLDAHTKRAEAALDRVIATAKAGEKLAMVLDIDETSLSGFCELRRDLYGNVVRDLFLGIDVGTSVIVGETTGTCICVLTPDAERTMRTCLAVSSHLAERHVKQDPDRRFYALGVGRVFATRALA